MTVDVEQLGGPVDARPLMRTVRARLDELVAELDEAESRRATVCPGWDVADLVAHIVGDDLGRLSRTHDGAAGPPWRPGEDLPAYLDRINEEWVVAFRRLSPAVLVSLLGAGGDGVLTMWDDAIGVDDAAGAVSWAGLEDGAGWMDHARDTTEYWIHEQHLREAVGRPHVDPDEVAAVVDVLARGLRSRCEDVARPTARTSRPRRRPGAAVAHRAARRPLVVRRPPHPRPPRPNRVPFATVTGTGDACWRRWSRHPAGGRGAFATSGDAAAAAAVVDHVAIIRAAE